MPLLSIESPPVVTSTWFKDLALSTNPLTLLKCSFVIKGPISFFESSTLFNSIEETAEVRSDTRLS